MVIQPIAVMLNNLNGEKVPIYGDGSSRRDYTYIDDVIEGVRRAMDYSATQYEIINLGNNRTVGLLEMVHALEGVLGTKADLEFLPEQPGDVPQTWADVSKAERLLGYRPGTEFADGLRRFVDWMRSYAAQA
ncbi:MAG TPA: GDP-mannose 4,6-dehydratase [Armatimonadota bacterium]|nr:GDP-mannose 4,6-dehydratase [Armatimonadota bacterium]